MPQKMWAVAKNHTASAAATSVRMTHMIGEMPFALLFIRNPSLFQSALLFGNALLLEESGDEPVQALQERDAVTVHDIEDPVAHIL